MPKTTCIALAITGIALTTAFGVIGPVTTAAEDAPIVDSNHAVAYYFHGNVRCATCRKIEAYASEAIHVGFADELEEGSLVWRAVNIEEPEHKHFADDFQLATRSVVLAEYRNGRVVRFTNLDKVWQLVRSKDEFTAYIQSETRAFLENG